MCPAIRTAISAPLAFPAAKKSSNIGEFFEFLSVRLAGATFSKTDSSRFQ